jgi:hypothetical protein
VFRYILSELIKVFNREDAYLAPMAQALLQMLQHATAQLTTYDQVKTQLAYLFNSLSLPLQRVKPRYKHWQLDMSCTD